MKKIMAMLMGLLMFTSTCFAGKEYRQSKQILEELHQLSIGFTVFINDLNETTSQMQLSTDQLESFNGLQDSVKETKIWLFVLDDMLTMEFLHEEANQFNLKAIAIIKKNIYAFKKHINTAIITNRKILTLTDNILLIRKYEQYRDYLLKIETLLRDLEVDLPVTSPIKK